MLHVQRGRDGPQNGASTRIAVVGCGPTGLYFLKNIIDLDVRNVTLTFFNATERLGQGMPYDPAVVGVDTLANIACEEIPDLVDSPHEWLEAQPDVWLSEHNVRRAQIGPNFIPTRETLGAYFSGQFERLVEKARSLGFTIHCLGNAVVKDVEPRAHPQTGFDVVYRGGASETLDRLWFDKVVIATGHEWPQNATHSGRLLASPWPVAALYARSPRRIGILGSSLSAVDVCLVLARKNGQFRRDFDGRLEYQPHAQSHDLKIVMHSRRGLLPSQRFHFEYPRIQVHQYMSEREIRDHIAANAGYLSLDFVFEKSLKQVVAEKSASLHAQIAHMDLEGFVAFMYRRRQRADQFEFLRQEYAVSLASIRNREPIFWKEILDDVAYTLNFYAKYLNSRDFLRARECLMPLVSHVVAFLPQPSSEQMLALYDAGCLVNATIPTEWTVEEDFDAEKVLLTHRNAADGTPVTEAYDLVVDCRGQSPAPFEAFPFPSLARQGLVSPARIGAPREWQSLRDDDAIVVGGVNVDDQFRSVDIHGQPSDDVFVLAAPHIHGHYPYHSGLPFCNEATRMVASALNQPKAVA